MLNFNEMEMRYGTAVAYHYLTEIEKAAFIVSATLSHVDPETRLANAIRAQDAVNASALAAA